MTLPTILESTSPSDSGQRPADDSGTYFTLSLWTVTGLTYPPTYAGAALFRGDVEESRWSFDYIGGADSGEFVVIGSIADLDAAVQGESEIRIERAGVVWYRARVTDYERFVGPDGKMRTRLFVEGYVTKLAQIRVERTIASGTTVQSAVQTILASDVAPNSRIPNVSTAITGSYALSGDIDFNCSALEALRTLAILQGSTEWGVSEGTQLYFIAAGTGVSNTGQVLLQGATSGIGESGSFGQAFNRVRAIGAIVGGAFLDVTVDNAAAQATYGIREVEELFPEVKGTNDLMRIAQNIADAESAGHGRAVGIVDAPTSRLETARTTIDLTIAGQTKFRFRGVDGAQFTDHYSRVTYSYRRGSPQNFTAEVWIGPAEETIVREFWRLRRGQRALTQAMVSIPAALGGSNALLDGSVHTDTLAGTCTLGDLILGLGAPAKWTRYAIGTNGKVLRSNGTIPLWSTFTIPDTMAINTLLYASSANVLAALATAASGVLVTSGAGVPSIATDIPTAVSIGGAYVYRASGTDVAIADGGTGASTAQAGFDALSPTTTLGDIIYRGAANNDRLAGNATTTRKLLSQVGTGAASAAPTWDTLVVGDIVATATDVLFGRSTALGGPGEEIACTAFARTILDDADAATVRATIGAGTGSGTVTAVTGTSPVASSGGATPAISLGVSAANKFLTSTALNTWTERDITAVGLAILDDATAGDQLTTLGLSVNGKSLVTAADYAAMRGLLDLEAGTDFLTPAAIAAAYQPLDAQLTDLAGLAYAGNALKVVRVNAGETAFELATAAAGSLDINGLTGADPALGDELPIYDISAAANRKITVEELAFILLGEVGGRLTLTSGTSVTTSDVTAAGTLYYAIHTHNKIALYDGTRWKMYTFTERSLALTLTSGKNYDVFLYDNAGTLTLELSAAWTNDTTRADALTTQDGVLVKSGATTRRYLGTIRASAANVTEDSLAKRFCWNAYNRVERDVKIVDATNSWTYTTASYHQANASAANQMEAVFGLAIDPVFLSVKAGAFNSGGNVNIGVGVGVDSTTVNSARVYPGFTVGGNVAVCAFSDYSGTPGIGYHYFAWLEISTASGTTTWYGDNGQTYVQSGMSGKVMA